MTKTSTNARRTALNKSTIFIQMASYRDPELIPTLEDCLKHADRPDNLRFGICRQYHPDDGFDDLQQYEDDDRFRILNVPCEKSKGACWARNKIQQLYREETYTLQLDSHHRFIKGWDTVLMKMLRKLQDKGHAKPLLTTYAPSYNPKDDPGKRERNPWKMDFHKFIPEGAVFFLPAVIPDWEKLKAPIPARFYSAHFAFAPGAFAKEVRHDPEYYFHGEEINIAVRAFTHGYDLFHPHIPVVWHEYTRKGRVKHWDDHVSDKTDGETVPWNKRNDESHLRNRKLFEMDGETRGDLDFGEYDFGVERTLRDYEKYAGLNFGLRAAQDHTRQKLNPPNPVTWESDEEWEASFENENYVERRLTAVWDVAFLRRLSTNAKIKWIFFGVEDEDGKLLYRRDLDPTNDMAVFKFHKSSVEANFESRELPHKWILWPVSDGDNFLEKHEEIIPCQNHEPEDVGRHALALSEQERIQLRKGLKSASSL